MLHAQIRYYTKTGYKTKCNIIIDDKILSIHTNQYRN